MSLTLAVGSWVPGQAAPCGCLATTAASQAGGSVGGGGEPQAAGSQGQAFCRMRRHACWAVRADHVPRGQIGRAGFMGTAGVTGTAGSVLTSLQARLVLTGDEQRGKLCCYQLIGAEDGGASCAACRTRRRRCRRGGRGEGEGRHSGGGDAGAGDGCRGAVEPAESEGSAPPPPPALTLELRRWCLAWLHGYPQRQQVVWVGFRAALHGGRPGSGRAAEAGAQGAAQGAVRVAAPHPRDVQLLPGAQAAGGRAAVQAHAAMRGGVEQQQPAGAHEGRWTSAWNKLRKRGSCGMARCGR